MGARICKRKKARVRRIERRRDSFQEPDVVRRPDISLVSAARLGQPQEGFFEGAPDLAVEVTSPGDKVGETQEKNTGILAGRHPADLAG